MNERALNERDLAEVTGGREGMSFARLAKDFARANRCAGCPHKMIYRQHEMCMEVYGELLQDFTSGKSVNMQCTRRRDGSSSTV